MFDGIVGVGVTVSNRGTPSPRPYEVGVHRLPHLGIRETEVIKFPSRDSSSSTTPPPLWVSSVPYPRTLVPLTTTPRSVSHDTDDVHRCTCVYATDTVDVDVHVPIRRTYKTYKCLYVVHGYTCVETTDAVDVHVSV